MQSGPRSDTGEAGDQKRETPKSLRHTGNKLSNSKSNIANRARGTNAMPEVYGLNEVMTKTQLRDIIEYLASLKSRPATLDADKPRALRGLPLAQAATGGHP